MSIKSASDGHVSVSSENGVATVEFSHPKGNSLPGMLLRKLKDAITAAGENTDTKVIHLRSAGRGAFCGGASFDELRKIDTVEIGTAFFGGFAEVILALIRAPQPVVISVQGKAVGGGVGLISAADYVIAAEAAEIRLSELSIGIGPLTIGPVVDRKIGPASFAELAWSCEWKSAQWSRDRGMYQELCPDMLSLNERTSKICKKFADYSGAAAVRLKKVTWDGTVHWDRLLLERARMTAELLLTPAAQTVLEKL